MPLRVTENFPLLESDYLFIQVVSKVTTLLSIGVICNHKSDYFFKITSNTGYMGSIWSYRGLYVEVI